MLPNGPIDPKCHALEPPERPCDGDHADPECGAFDGEPEPARGEDKVVEDVCEVEHGEVEGWELHQTCLLVCVNSNRGKTNIVVNVCYTAHDDEGDWQRRQRRSQKQTVEPTIMQRPPSECNLPHVQKVVPILCAHVNPKPRHTQK